MIRLTRQRHWMAPETAEHLEVPWGIGRTPRALAPDWVHPGEPWAFCSVNGSPISEAEWDLQLADGCHVAFSVRPGLAPGVAAATAGQVAASTVAAPSFFALAFPILKSVALALISNALLAPGKPQLKEGDKQSATYAFLGLQSNARAVGLPIPVVYGRHRVAPPVINQQSRNWLDSNGDAQSELYMLFAVSEGPIQAIGDKTTDGGPYSVELGNALEGLQIENQPAGNFSKVEAHVRLGTNDQTAIAGFSQPVQQYNVGVILHESSDTVNVEVTSPGVFTAADTEITKWDTEVSYTMGDEADEFTVVITFASGLYSINTSTGELINNLASFQGRYRKVDGSGVPYGDYIVLPTEPIVQAAKQGQFSVEFSHRFYETLGYVASTDGHYLSGTSLMTTVPAYTIDDTDIVIESDVAFSWMGWVKGDGTFAASIYQFFDWLDAFYGFAAYYRVQSNGNHELTFQVGSGSTVTTFTYVCALNEQFRKTTIWEHLAFTFQENYDGAGTSRARIYFRGNLLQEAYSANGGAYNTALPIYLMSNDTNGRKWRGGMDDCAFFTRELPPSEVAQYWNQGVTPAPSFTGDENGLIVAFLMNLEAEVLTIFYAYPVVGPGANSTPGLNLGGDGNDAGVSTDTGPCGTPEEGTPSRDTFIIEYQRIEPEDTSTYSVDEATWSTIQLRLYEDFQYPSVALLAVKIRATDQLNNPNPLVTCLAEGRLLPTWDGVDAVYPTMVDTWSRNPAWVAADILLNDKYGMGAFYEARDLDVNQFSAFADWCAAVVYDGSATSTLVGAASLTAGGTEAPNWTVDAFEWRVASLPANFVSATASMVSSGFYLLASGTTVSPSFPAFVTSQVTASAAEIREVIYDQTNDYWKIRVPAVASATGSTFTVASTDYVLKQYEPRMLYDGVFDRKDRPAWDCLLQCLTTARAAPIRLGARLSLFYDDVRTAVALIGMGSIIEGSMNLEYTDSASRPNAEEIEFYDERQNYERLSADLEHPDLTDPTLQSSFRWRRLTLEGVTRRSQVMRHMKRDLNVFNLIRRTVTFDVGIDSLLYQPGSRMAIAHDVPSWGQSGRVWEDVATNNLIAGWFDLSDWTINSDAVAAAVTATVGPLGYGIVYQLSTTGSATGSATYAYDAGVWPTTGVQFIETFWVLEGTAVDFSMMVSDDDSAVDYDAQFEWSGGVPSDLSLPAGMTSTITSVGSGWYRIDCTMATPANRSGHQRSVTLKCQINATYPSKDIEVWGPMLIDDQSQPNETPYMQVKLDRDVTIAASTDYQIQVESADSNMRDTVRINTIASPAGTYSAGSAITLSGVGLSFLPAKNDEWALGTVAAGETEDFTIVEIKLNPEQLTHTVRAVEYNEAVYSDDFGELAPQALVSTPPASLYEIPPGVHTMSVHEETVTGPDGAVTIGAALTFTHFADTFHAVWQTNIFVAHGAGSTNLGAADLVATLPRNVTSHRILNFPFSRGQSYTIFAQPVTRTGGSQYRAFASYVHFSPDGLAIEPLAPLNFRAAVAGFSAVYLWDDPGDLARVKSIEIRRGGWILGTRMAVLPPGATQWGPVDDWVGSPENSWGQSDIPVLMRSRLGTGQMSPVVTLTFAPDIVGADGDALEQSEEDAGWGGTKGAVSAVGNFDWGASGSRKQLAPTGGGTSHTYVLTGETFTTSIPVMLQIGVKAYQVHPATLSQVSALGPLNSRTIGRWTFEGPLVHLAGDPGLSTDCSLKIEVAHSPSATAGSDYRAYRPGIYNMRSYKVKVTITRPSTDYGFYVTRLACRATKIQAARPDYIGYSALLPG